MRPHLGACYLVRVPSVDVCVLPFVEPLPSRRCFQSVSFPAIDMSRSQDLRRLLTCVYGQYSTIFLHSDYAQRPALPSHNYVDLRLKGAMKQCRESLFSASCMLSIFLAHRPRKQQEAVQRIYQISR